VAFDIGWERGIVGFLMTELIERIVLQATGGRSITECAVLQRLWSGYGSIVRYGLEGASVASVIVKHVSPPNAGNHPRGWNTDLSHERKLTSYRVETRWYENFAGRCDRGCRVPQCLAVAREGDEVVMVLEDLDAAGYSRRLTRVSESELFACLRWLANFHATFLSEQVEGLWESGTYWHLETRPDELKILAKEDAALYEAAGRIDARLKGSSYHTLVHGDAKLANFCFADEGEGVAAVDFQYVGGGCGMKDVAYFIGSCLTEDACAEGELRLLDLYFESLREGLLGKGVALDFDELEADWRRLYPVAWTDFHRFLKGWSPGHWKINTYSERLAHEVVAGLKEARS